MRLRLDGRVRADRLPDPPSLERAEASRPDRPGGWCTPCAPSTAPLRPGPGARTGPVPSAAAPSGERQSPAGVGRLRRASWPSTRPTPSTRSSGTAPPSSGGWRRDGPPPGSPLGRASRDRTAIGPRRRPASARCLPGTCRRAAAAPLGPRPILIRPWCWRRARLGHPPTPLTGR